MWWPFAKPKKELDMERTYLRVQFLTSSQKTQKQAALQQLHKQYQGDEQSIVPYDSAFPVSYRFLLNTAEIAGTVEPIKNKMLIKELLCHLEVTKNQWLEEFMKTYVKDIQLLIMNEQMLSRNEVVPLFSEVEATLYTPSQILEIIYEPRSIWERIKSRTKQVVKGFPRLLLGLLGKIAAFMLGLIGLDGAAKSVIMKIVPTKSIIQWLVSFIAMFFPMLAPIVAILNSFLG